MLPLPIGKMLRLHYNSYSVFFNGEAICERLNADFADRATLPHHV